MECATCQDGEGYCAACGGSAGRVALMSTAGCRGTYWAEGVMRALGPRRPPSWPAFAGKARAIALRWVADLGGDAATREARARHCWERARETYEGSAHHGSL